MKLKIGLSVAFTSIWYFLSAFVFMPTLSLFADSGIYWNIIIYFTVIGLIWTIDTYYTYRDTTNYSRISFVIAGLTLIILIVASIFTSSLFNAESYHSMIGNVEKSEFNSHVQPIPTDQMLIVDDEIAKRVGEKLLGSDPGLGSRAKLGTFTLQKVKGKLYWIAPLLHSGFFKWYSFSSNGTPGYVRVSATNQEDYELITKDGKGNDLSIKYQTASYFSQDLSRHIYSNGYSSELYNDMTFEVDDSWYPYWTTTLYDTKIGFYGDDATGVLVIDPMSGVVKQYSTQDAPAWIDRIQPASFIHTQIDDWGMLIHGWFNPSNRDKISVTDDYSLVLGNDGNSYFYYGLTSTGSEESTVGFVMVNTRSKQAHWFKQAGATESAAQKSAQGKFPEKGYTSSDGITYNISGHATYEFLLKDGAGLMKMISFVNVHDHTIVGIGESRQEALRDYESQITDRGNGVAINKTDMNIKDITSSLIRFGSEDIRGTTYYYFTLASNPKMKFVSTAGVSDDLVLSQPGDNVRVQYLDGTSKTISIMKFQNLTIGIIDEESDLAKASIDTSRLYNIEKLNEKAIDQKWKDLPIEEKKKLIK